MKALDCVEMKREIQAAQGDSMRSASLTDADVRVRG